MNMYAFTISLLTYFLMNIIAWNIRGLDNPSSIRRLRKLIKDHSVSCFAIFEPKVYTRPIKNLEFKLNCIGSCSNLEGNIWFFWKVGVACSIIKFTSQYIMAQIEIGGIQSIVLFVHASCNPNTRQLLWDE